MSNHGLNLIVIENNLDILLQEQSNFILVQKEIVDQKYKILISQEIADLENKVNHFLNNGWKPQGGIAISNGNYFQAIYRID